MSVRTIIATLSQAWHRAHNPWEHKIEEVLNGELSLVVRPAATGTTTPTPTFEADGARDVIPNAPTAYWLRETQLIGGQARNVAAPTSVAAYRALWFSGMEELTAAGGSAPPQELALMRNLEFPPTSLAEAAH